MSKLLLQDDFKRTVMEALGKDGKSISALAKELERSGHRLHRLIITGYLRALADLNLVKEKEVPPSKVYVPLNYQDDNIYTRAYQAAVETSSDPDLRALQVLHSLLRRPVFECELKSSGVDMVKGRRIDQSAVSELRSGMPKRLKARFSADEPAYIPEQPIGPEEYLRTLESMAVACTQSKNLVLDTRQSKLL